MNNLAAYIFRRLLLMIPTILGIMLVSFIIIQFVPGGPVERMIAQLQGHNTDATARFSGGGGGDTATGNMPQMGAGEGSKYRGAQGLDPEFVAELEKMYGFDKPAHVRFIEMVGNYARFDLGKSFRRDGAGDGKNAGIDLARLVVNGDYLPDLHTARDQEGR